MKYSLSLSGVLVTVLGSLFVNWGFSETCTTEIVAWVPVVLGSIMTWIGRVRVGDINIFGFKK